MERTVRTHGLDRAPTPAIEIAFDKWNDFPGIRLHLEEETDLRCVVLARDDSRLERGEVAGDHAIARAEELRETLRDEAVELEVVAPSPQYQMSPSSVLQVGLLVHDVNEDFLGGPVARLLPCCDFDLYLRIGLQEVRRDLR
jgi:hypothetical protein